MLNFKKFIETYITPDGKLVGFDFKDDSEISVEDTDKLLKKIEDINNTGDTNKVKITLLDGSKLEAFLYDIDLVASHDEKEEYLLYITSEVPIVENDQGLGRAYFIFPDKEIEDKWVKSNLIINIEQLS